MSIIPACDVPPDSLLHPHARGDGFADCYVTRLPGAVTQAEFGEAFYTSPLFKVERTLLEYLACTPATDSDARELAAGKAKGFSAWRVEGQSVSELLLADVTGSTRSWLSACLVVAAGQPTQTLLYVGSA